MEYLYLCYNLRVLEGLCHGIIVQCKRSDKLSGVPWCCWDSTIVLDEKGITLSFLLGSTFWVQSCLQKNITGVAVPGIVKYSKLWLLSPPLKYPQEDIIPTPLCSDRGRFCQKGPVSVSHRIMAPVELQQLLHRQLWTCGEYQLRTLQRTRIRWKYL